MDLRHRRAPAPRRVQKTRPRRKRQVARAFFGGATGKRKGVLDQRLKNLVNVTHYALKFELG